MFVIRYAGVNIVETECVDPQEELVKLLLKSNSFRFEGDSLPNDEKLPAEAKFKLNFDELFNNYVSTLAECFLKKIKNDVYGKPNRGVECIVGLGDSGTRLSIAAQTLLQSTNGFSEQLKSYRWAYLNKAGEIIGDLRYGDKVALIDECGINFSAVLKHIHKVNGHMEFLRSVGRLPDNPNLENPFNYQVMIVGIDMRVVDEERGILKSEIAASEIDRLYKTNIKMLPISTIDDVVGFHKKPVNGSNAYKIGDFEKEILDNYIAAQNAKLK